MIKVGADNVSDVKYGTKNVSRIYRGTNFVWSTSDNITLYKLSCPYRLPSDYEDNVVESLYGIPEYNFHLLLIPLNNDDIGNIHIKYATLDGSGYFSNRKYLNYTRQIIRLDDDAFSINVDHVGSSGMGKNLPGYFTATSTASNSSYNLSCNLNWYFGGARATIDGSYSSKIIHVPSKSYEFDVLLGKYLCPLGYEITNWSETCRKLSYSSLIYDEKTNKLLYAIYDCSTTQKYYYSIVNEQLLWFHSIYNYDTKNPTYLDLSTLIGLLPTENIIENVTANNTVSIQNLHFKTKENKDNRVKYQCVLYYSSSDSSLQGYLPNVYKLTLSSRSPRIIFVQEPSEDKFIYWGWEYANAGCYDGYMKYRVILGYEYDDLITLTSKHITVDFNPLNFATISTLENKLNLTLFDNEYDDELENDGGYIVYYVAIPEEYFGKYKPSVTPSSAIVASYDMVLASDSSIKYDSSSEYYICKFNGLTYYLYMYTLIPSKTTVQYIKLEKIS